MQLNVCLHKIVVFESWEIFPLFFVTCIALNSRTLRGYDVSVLLMLPPLLRLNLKYVQSDFIYPKRLSY